MNLRRVAIVVMLTFLGQQVGSVWAGAMFSGHPHDLPSVSSSADGAMAMHCDDTEQQSSHEELVDRTSVMDREGCCDFECECCVGHCQSTFALLSLSLNLYHSNHSFFPAAAQSTRTTNQRHFRPPIFA